MKSDAIDIRLPVVPDHILHGGQGLKRLRTARWPRPRLPAARVLAISHPACSRRSPEHPGERARLPTRHVHRRRHRRDARQAPEARRAARRRSGPVRRRRIGSSTSAAPKDFSSGSPRSSGKAFPDRRRKALALRQANCRLGYNHWRITTGCSRRPLRSPRLRHPVRPPLA